MNVLRLVVIGLMVCTVLAVGVALGRRADGPGDRERFDKLFAQGNLQGRLRGLPAASPSTRRPSPIASGPT